MDAEVVSWLAAVGIAAILVGGAYLFLLVFGRDRPPPPPSTDVVPWQPTPPEPPLSRPAGSMEAEFGRAVLRAADRYHDLTRP